MITGAVRARLISCARRAAAPVPCAAWARLSTSESASGTVPGPGPAAPTATSGSEVSANPVEEVKEYRDHPYLTQNARYMPGFSYPAPRKLEQIIKYALLEREPAHKIREIWSEFHDVRSDCAATVLTRGEYEGIMARASKNPYFIYPVRKGDGKFFTLVSQFQPPYCLFTYLEAFQRDPTRAEPYMAVTFFDDFLERKGIVLVRGDFSGHLTKEDASRLLRLTKHYYSTDPKKVEEFNRRPAEFDVDAYFAECP